MNPKPVNSTFAAPPSREKFSAPIECPGCHQNGSATWEENAGLAPSGPQPVLLSVSNGFYLRVRRPHTGATEIVCSVCDAVVGG